ncbi:DUF58 domain-containing protein [Pelagibacterium sp. 26DY04]|uniref:DUF58 domain-containing protein n=1 Tax=Pelagibacterium sp. 26DY04 TaxID=2967130 RepID=UPI002814B75D|nr:DUF58 domain-containing protein [Pelagibacterium sp. 26DY04]WMT86813.1 DUF58 domain-containing protein [Pelagibacterium sp. 26DY04]
MRPPAALLEQLTTSRLLPAHAQPSIGTGERRSRRKGPGMEFVDHRPYRAGDDTRHLDPHLFARTGDYVVREYALNQQLPVTIVIDPSASMGASEPSKFTQARLIAQLLGFAALAGGDQVQAAVPTPLGNRLSPRWHGAARADLMFDWIGKLPAGKGEDFLESLRTLHQDLAPRGLVIAISDWWHEAIGPVLDTLFAAGQEVLAIQVLGASEIDPQDMLTGVVTMEDSESSEEIELVVDRTLLDRYRELFAQRQEELRAMFNAKHWHFVTVSAQDDLDQLFMRTFRAQGVLS